MHRYSVPGHGSMLRDAARVDAYARAVAECVRPGDVVVELGTGTGLFALLACRAGAKTVYAIESDDVIELARANAAANGLQESIVFLHELSTRVDLPERADVIVSDLRGVVPLFEAGLAAVLDARERFLAPGGRMIPASDRLMVAAVEEPRLHHELTSPWRDGLHGVALPAARVPAVNTWVKAEFQPGQLATSPACLAEIDYAAAESPDVGGRVRLVAERDARVHGFAMWFETTLSPGATFTMSPLAPAAGRVYGHAFFPWPEAVALAAGDALELAVDATYAGGDYLWRWSTEAPGARFRQSSFLGEPVSSTRLARRAADHAPSLGEEGLIDLGILESMRAGRNLGDIASSLRARHPQRFPRWEDALAHVGELSERYSRSG